MRTKLVTLLSLVAVVSTLGGCSAATTRSTAWTPRYYPPPQAVVSSGCAVSVCDSHTSNRVGAL